MMNKKVILHIQLAGPYTEGASYQENILPKYHKRMGYEVFFLAPCYEWRAGALVHTVACKKETGNGIILERLEFVKFINEYITRKIKYVSGIYKKIEEIKPDIIMLHDVQSFSSLDICRYIRNHQQTKLIVDCHTDYSNSATNWISKYILHGIIWRLMAKRINKYADVFYGVLPAREEFLVERYGIDRSKVKLLLMGADDDYAEEYSDDKKERIRQELGFKSSDFVIVTGGKIDLAKKQTLLLMQAIHEISNESVRLLVFGSVDRVLQEEFEKLVDGSIVNYIGWIPSQDIYKYLNIANLAAFPGRHSVLWEQSVAMGIPLVVKYWQGTTHIDIGGNVRFLYNDSLEEMKKTLGEVIFDEKCYRRMLEVAQSPAKKKFFYSRIASECLHNVV